MSKKILVVLLAFVGCVVSAYAQVAVTVGDGSGNPGDTNKQVAISVGDLSGKNMIAGDITVTYDPAKLTLTDVQTGALISGWASEAQPAAADLPKLNPAWHYPVYKDTSGSVKIAIYGKTPINAGGALMQLVFSVNAGASGSTPVTLTDAKLYSQDPNSPPTLKEDQVMFALTKTNGTFTIQGGGGVVGDVTGGPGGVPDGKVDASDLQAFVNFVLNASSYDSRYDVAPAVPDGKVDSVDIQKLVNILLGV